MPIPVLLTHGAIFVAGAFLAKSVRPLVERAGRALRPVARDAIREGILATRGLKALADEARAEIEAAEPRAELRAFPDRRLIETTKSDD
jgi:hypothetical protein